MQKIPSQISLYSKYPSISCVVSELVLNAIIHANASEICVDLWHVHHETQQYHVRVRDNGRGICEHLMREILGKETHVCVTRDNDEMRIGCSLSDIAHLCESMHVASACGANAQPLCLILENHDQNDTLSRTLTDLSSDTHHTTVFVSNIFNALPVRRAAMKFSTEITNIINAIQILSISYPEMAFKFVANGDLKLNLSGTSSSASNPHECKFQRIKQYFGPGRASKMKFVRMKDGSMTGFLSDPLQRYDGSHIHRASHCLLFLGNRPVRAPAVEECISEMYKRYITTKRRQKDNKFFGCALPMYVLHLELPEESFRIVKSGHTARADVVFSDVDHVLLLLKHLVQSFFDRLDGKWSQVGKNLEGEAQDESSRKSFHSHQPTHVHTSLLLKNRASSKHSIAASRSERASVIPSKPTPPTINNVLSSFLHHDLSNMNKVCCSQPGSEDATDSPLLRLKVPKKSDISTLEVICQWDCKFILAKSTNALYIIDQHACDERIRYETILNDVFVWPDTSRFRAKSKAIQCMICTPPRIFTAPSALHAQWIRMNQEQLQERWWWKVESTVHHELSFTLHEYPVIAQRHLHEDTLLSFADQAVSGGNDTSGDAQSVAILPRVLRECIQSVSCRSAIMFGDVIPHEKCEQLLESLMQCHNPFECCHGRPSFYKLADL